MINNFSKILAKFCSYWQDYNLIFDMLLKQTWDSKMQKLQDFKTIFAATHLLFKIVINLRILKNSQEYVYNEVISL